MVDLFVCLIINNRRTFDKVPVGLQDAVKKELSDMGLDENGNAVITTVATATT